MCFWYVYEAVISSCKQTQHANNNVSVNHRTNFEPLMASGMHPRCSNRQTNCHSIVTTDVFIGGTFDKMFLQGIPTDKLYILFVHEEEKKKAKDLKVKIS